MMIHLMPEVVHKEILGIQSLCFLLLLMLLLHRGNWVDEALLINVDPQFICKIGTSQLLSLYLLD